MGRPVGTHCKRGHEIAKVGRYSNGTCRGCKTKAGQPYRVGNAPIGVCKRGHLLDGNRVMHNGKARGCLICHRKREAARRAAQAERARKASQTRARVALMRPCVPTQPLLDLVEKMRLPVKRVGVIVSERIGVKPGSVERMLYRGIQTGMFSVQAADQLCIGLDVHPVEVYGAAWFGFGEAADAV